MKSNPCYPKTLNYNDERLAPTLRGGAIRLTREREARAARAPFFQAYTRFRSRIVTLRLGTLFRFLNRRVWAWTCCSGGTQALPPLLHAPCPRAW